LGTEYRYLTGFDMRKCSVYGATSGNVIMRMYIDEEAKWPIAFEFTIHAEDAYINVPLELVVDTNIQALKKR